MLAMCARRADTFLPAQPLDVKKVNVETPSPADPPSTHDVSMSHLPPFTRPASRRLDAGVGAPPRVGGSVGP